MNPFYKFIIKGGTELGTKEYSGVNLQAGYYDLSGGVGTVAPDVPIIDTISPYCIMLPVNIGDTLVIKTKKMGADFQTYALTDINKKIYFVTDRDTNYNPETVEISCQGYIFVNFNSAGEGDPETDSFSLKVTQVETHVCTPIYSNDMEKTCELENAQRFFREKLSGKLSFVREDFDWLDEQPFETQFVLFVQQTFDNGKTWGNFMQGKFMKTDCTWDVDNKKCEVNPDTYDIYNDILNGWEKEYDLIKLKPEMSRLSIVKRPLLQVYVPGDNVVSCFLGGTYWEQEVVEPVDNTGDLKSKYHFALATRYIIWQVSYDSELQYEVKGRYIGKDGTYTRDDNQYYIKWVKDFLINTSTGQVRRDVCVIYRASDNVARYYSQQTSDDGSVSGTYTFNPILGSTAIGNPTSTPEYYDIYSRWLLAKGIVNDTKAYPLPTNDILEDNRNYTYVIGVTSDYYYLSTRLSTEATEYGLNDDGLYFQPPLAGIEMKFYPVAKSTWRKYSIWFAFSMLDDVIEQSGWTPWTLKDTFKLSSVIDVLLQQFSNIRHKETEECSQFLYGSSNPVTGQQFTLLITQKSNILHGNYTQAAQKASATLKNILDALKNIYQCYWYVENGLLKIEHVSFFKNGGTYTERNPVIGADLTNLENVRNKKKWGYLTSSYEFDKSEMPARYQFAWMDDVTEMFEGYPLEIRSKYVTEDQIEDITISNITTDVDYMMLNPSAISQDGFAMFAGVYTNLWTQRPLFFVYNGYIGTDGDVVYNASGDGKGWRYTKFDNVVPGVTYKVLNSAREQINGFYFHFYDISGNSIGRAETTNGLITVPDNCYILAMSWRAQQDASPTTLGVVETSSIYFVQAQQLGLPFVQREIDGANLNMQNGYLSFITLLPNYWTYDLPSKKVTINETDYTLSHISRKKKQKVKFPTLEDLDTSKLVKTSLGNGQIEKISVNLSSRMNEVTLKYDTE